MIYLVIVTRRIFYNISGNGKNIKDCDKYVSHAQCSNVFFSWLYIASTLRTISANDDKVAIDGSILMDFGVSSIALNLKFDKSWARAIFDCIKPNRNPMQFLGPSPVKTQ